MPKYTKILIVLPCHSLEDFPIHHRGTDAANLLANWSAIWHPALIASSQEQPSWQQADNPDLALGLGPLEQDSGPAADQPGDRPGVCLAVIPTISESILDSELLANLEKNAAVVISNQSNRSEIIRLALAANPQATELTQALDPELAQDFLALGYAFLQVQIMTRQLRYSSNLNEADFSTAVVKAANLATAGKTESAREALVRCFDMLLEEKNGYYPVEPELIDVVLTAPTTLGRSLVSQLTADHPLNLLMTGCVARSLVSQHPEVAEHLKRQIENQAVTLIGGLDEELPDTLVATESTLNQLQRGLSEMKRLFAVQPNVFMRRRFGLTSSTPGMLEQLNFDGAIHASLDDGKFPRSSSCNIRWTGDDERSVLAFGELPLSAADAGSFIGLGVRLGEAIDSAHLAAALLVHWPGDTCESFGDLVRISKYGPLFGSFVSLGGYFDSVYDPGYGDSFAADEYKNPYLKQAVDQQDSNPISKFTTYWRRYYQLAASRALLVQACAKFGLAAAAVEGFEERFDEIQLRFESALNAASADGSELDRQLTSCLEDLSRIRQPVEEIGMGPVGIEVINPASFRRRIEFKTHSNGRGSVKQEPPVILCDQNQNGSHWLVEVPPMGSASIGTDPSDHNDALVSDPSVGDGMTLRNEFFELNVDETTGGIRGVQLYRNRVNLAGQQLAVRIPGRQDERRQPLTKARYTQMVADGIRMEMESRLAGKIISRGRLMDSDAVLAEYEQSVRVVRGQRVVEVDVEIRPRTPLSKSINHYICSRLAWKSEASRVIANAGEIRQEINSDWFPATNFFDIVQDEHRLTMLTGGLPFHRRVSRRMVDSVLMVGREQQQNFRFGLAVNQGYAMAAATAWLMPFVETAGSPLAGIGNSTRWLFHFDCKNILVTWWQPFFDDVPDHESTKSTWSGIRIRLRETEGRAGKLSIRCPDSIESGEQQNFAGDALQDLEVAEDDPSRVSLAFGRHDYFQVSIRWKK